MKIFFQSSSTSLTNNSKPPLSTKTFISPKQTEESHRKVWREKFPIFIEPISLIPITQCEERNNFNSTQITLFSLSRLSSAALLLSYFHLVYDVPKIKFLLLCHSPRFMIFLRASVVYFSVKINVENVILRGKKWNKNEESEKKKWKLENIRNFRHHRHKLPPRTHSTQNFKVISKRFSVARRTKIRRKWKKTKKRVIHQ